MLEVGIGTNNLDVPSNMGVAGVPGASLRAWSELFPSALIFGADVDRRILFQEERIRTYYVDQTDSATIDQLFGNIGDRKLDLIIDDGLHEFEANRTFFEGAYARLADDGIYIVEDVPRGDISAWEMLLSAGGYSAVLLRPPHPTNAIDNCLVIILGRNGEGRHLA